MADTLVKANYGVSFSAEIELDLGIDGMTNPKVTQKLDTNLTSSVPGEPDISNLFATLAWSDRFNLSAGAATLNLASLARGSLPALDLTDNSPIFYVFYNLITNSGALTIEPGASNGYAIFGAADAKIVLQPGHWAAYGILNVAGADNNLNVVASGDRTVDLSSGDADATVVVGILAL